MAVHADRTRLLFLISVLGVNSLPSLPYALRVPLYPDLNPQPYTITRNPLPEDESPRR
jgi:hypothetical protein